MRTKKETRGRKTKVSKYELKEELENHNGSPTTVSALAKRFEVTTQTIRNVVRKLRRDGVSILPTSHGLQLIDSVDNQADAVKVLQVGKWMVGESIGLSIIADALKRPLKESYKLLQSTLTRQELQIIKSNLLLLIRQADILELEE